MAAARREQHLTRNEQFKLVYDRGSSWISKTIVMKSLSNVLNFSRYGITVSKRAGKAVVRNRIRRLLREILRKNPPQGGWDIIFIARAPAAEADFWSLGKSVRELLLRAGLLTEANEEYRTGTN